MLQQFVETNNFMLSDICNKLAQVFFFSKASDGVMAIEKR